MRISLLAAMLLMMLGLSSASADEPKKEDVDKAQAKVKQFLSELKNGESGEVVSLNNADLHDALPNHLFFAARFRIYPIARIMPEGYAPSNVMAVDKAGKVARVKDVKALTAFFKENMAPAKTAKAAEKTAKAWLTLTQEFHQDGFYKFDIRELSGLEANGAVQSATGKAVVMAGGNGELGVTIAFEDGKVESVTENPKIRPGPRPICQATKLLDVDPIVRRMAEQDLLYMGIAVRGYLMEQRATAGPELREAIDRLWQRIEKNGW